MLAVVPLRVQQPPRWVARYRPFGVVEQGVTRPVAFLQTVASPSRAFNAAHPTIRASRVEDHSDTDRVRGGLVIVDAASPVSPQE